MQGLDAYDLYTLNYFRYDNKINIDENVEYIQYILPYQMSKLVIVNIDISELI